MEFRLAVYLIGNSTVSVYLEAIVSYFLQQVAAFLEDEEFIGFHDSSNLVYASSHIRQSGFLDRPSHRCIALPDLVLLVATPYAPYHICPLSQSLKCFHML